MMILRFRFDPASAIIPLDAQLMIYRSPTYETAASRSSRSIVPFVCGKSPVRRGGVHVGRSHRPPPQYV